ncbi:DUF2057 domain-containing protein [Enterovibrio norvegicus]|uniref:DUF2057 family protein n=1 Tax=Enterovibrio norvegicus TaxID=188144 RepID=UPI003D0BF43C
MGLLRKTIATTVMMASFSSFAAVNVEFDVAIEPMLVNGEEVNALLSQMTHVELPDGPNQLVVRVSKLIRENGVFTKFKSEPVVMTFDVSNADIIVEPGKKFTSVQEVGDFETKPTLKLSYKNGEALNAHTGVLTRGKGILRDYGDELAAYNMANDYTFSFAGKTTEPVAALEETLISVTHSEVAADASPVKKTEKSQEGVKISLRETVKVESLKGQFKSLTPTEKKEFLSWAIMQ